MVTHSTFLSFERRWQLPVYFQLRWKEIVARLEDALSNRKLEPVSNLKKGWSPLSPKIRMVVTTKITQTAEIAPFVMASTAALWSATTACWDRNVFAPQLAHRCWKLMLQILSRYRTWIENNLQAFPVALPKPLPSASEKA